MTRPITPKLASSTREHQLARAKQILIEKLNDAICKNFSAESRILVKEDAFHVIYWDLNPNNAMRVAVRDEFRKTGWQARFWLYRAINPKSVKWEFIAPANLEY